MANGSLIGNGAAANIATVRSAERRRNQSLAPPRRRLRWATLVVNNGPGVSLSGDDIRVAGSTHFREWKAHHRNKHAHKRYRPNPGTVSASGATGYVIGNLQKFINNNAAQSTKTFEVGTASSYTPLTFTPLANPTGTNAAPRRSSCALFPASIRISAPPASTQARTSTATGRWLAHGAGSIAAAGYKMKGEFVAAGIDAGAEHQQVHRHAVCQPIKLEYDGVADEDSDQHRSHHDIWREYRHRGRCSVISPSATR